MASELDFLFDTGDNDERRLHWETVFRRAGSWGGEIIQVELKLSPLFIASRAEGAKSLLNGQSSFVAHSSRGLGHLPLKEEITGSNPVCATKDNKVAWLL